MSYRRDGGRVAPPDHEMLDVTGSRFELWRSNGGLAVGRFAGELPAVSVTSIANAAAGAAGAGDLVLVPHPDGAVESVRVPGASATVGQFANPDGPWGVLLADLRLLLDELVAFPRAALRLEVSPAWKSASLVHTGPEPLTVDLEKLRIRAVLWAPGNEMVGDWTSPPLGLGVVTSSPGWELDLPYAHGLDTRAGVVHTYVLLSIEDNGRLVDVQLVAQPTVG